MPEPVRLMIEQGKKRTVAVAFEWPGWERSAKSESDALERLGASRPRFAKVAKLAGLGDAFSAAGEFDVVERTEGTGMTDFHGVSARPAMAEQQQLSDAECERKLSLLHASWECFDAVAAHVSEELRKGPRGGGRDRDRIVQHVNVAEIHEFAKKVGVVTPIDAWKHPAELARHREAFCAAIREANARGVMARSWTVQFVIRRSAYHMLDHAWEMEDRDLS